MSIRKTRKRTSRINRNDTQTLTRKNMRGGRRGTKNKRIQKRKILTKKKLMWGGNWIENKAQKAYNDKKSSFTVGYGKLKNVVLIEDSHTNKPFYMHGIVKHLLKYKGQTYNTKAPSGKIHSDKKTHVARPDPYSIQRPPKKNPFNSFVIKKKPEYQIEKEKIAEKKKKFYANPNIDLFKKFFTGYLYLSIVTDRFIRKTDTSEDAKFMETLPILTTSLKNETGIEQFDDFKPSNFTKSQLKINMCTCIQDHVQKYYEPIFTYIPEDGKDAEYYKRTYRYLLEHKQGIDTCIIALKEISGPVILIDGMNHFNDITDSSIILMIQRQNIIIRVQDLQTKLDSPTVIIFCQEHWNGLENKVLGIQGTPMEKVFSCRFGIGGTEIDDILLMILALSLRITENPPTFFNFTNPFSPSISMGYPAEGAGSIGNELYDAGLIKDDSTKKKSCIIATSDKFKWFNKQINTLNIR